MALLGAKIYVAGGVKDREGGYHNDVQQHVQNLLPAPPLSSVEVYDFQQGSWGVQIEMPADHGGVLWPGVVADAATNKVPLAAATCCCHQINLIIRKSRLPSAARRLHSAAHGY